MAKEQSPKAKVVLELLAKFPDAATKTLAQKAYRANPELWNSLETCRCSVRYYRGAQGRKNRSGATNKTHFREPQQPGDPFGKLPEGREEMPDWEPFDIPGPCRALVLGDVHVPYHDTEALVIAAKEGQKAGVDTVILLGDFMDCFALSRWEKDPRERNFKRELDTGRAVLEVLREAFDGCRIIYKLGNHDERLESYLTCKAPELLDIAEFELASMLRCAELNVEVVTDLRPITLGKLYLIHGHEYRFAISNPVNPARGLYMRGKVLSMCAHFHQSSQHSEKSMDDSVVSCWSIGCLCSMRPRYMPLNKWNHGYSIAAVDEDGAFQVDNKRIIDGGAWS